LPEKPAKAATPADQPKPPRPKPADPPPVKTPAPKTPRPLPLGRRQKPRIASGREDIDSRLDLHGLTQEEAHRALAGFLRGAQAAGARTVLVITGKGREDDPYARRGVLRRLVPMWLAEADLRGIVMEFSAAHVAHGGEGALYVRLRRRRIVGR
jgi:DNA-nicking Smr family endonuclease